MENYTREYVQGLVKHTAEFCDKTLLKAIKVAVDNADELDLDVGFVEVVDDRCDFTQSFTIEKNDKGEYCVINENGHCVKYLQDLTFTEKERVLQEVRSQL